MSQNHKANRAVVATLKPDQTRYTEHLCKRNWSKLKKIPELASSSSRFIKKAATSDNNPEFSSTRQVLVSQNPALSRKLSEGQKKRKAHGEVSEVIMTSSYKETRTYMTSHPHPEKNLQLKHQVKFLQTQAPLR